MRHGSIKKEIVKKEDSMLKKVHKIKIHESD